MTWRDLASDGTVAYTSTTVRVDDGCDAGLYAVTVGAHTLDTNKPIGPLDVCAGGGGPLTAAAARIQAAVVKFDAVLLGRATWSRGGDVLRVTSTKYGSIDLHADGVALALAGEHWIAQRVIDHGSEIYGSFGAATLLIGRDDTVTATDGCHAIASTATITETTVSFGAGSRTGRRQCTSDISPQASSAIDTVLSGRITYAIIGNRLLLYGSHGAIVSYAVSGCASGPGCPDPGPATVTPVPTAVSSSR